MKIQNKKIKSIFLGLVSFAIALPGFVLAQTQTITISTSVPGFAPNSVASNGPGAFVANFYQFALIIAGILAFGAIVYGGVKYALAAGNPSGQSEGKEWVKGALYGLLLLAGAYIILYTINPQLLNLTLPTINNVSVNGVTSGGLPPGGNSSTTATGCAGGGTCGTLPNCTPSANVNCGGAPEMVSTLNCIQAADPNFNVSEGYPPTVDHSSSCHNTGCCVDTTVPAGGNTCASVQSLISAAQQCGATVANEYSNCNGQTYVHTTGNNVHINAPKTNGC